MLKTGFLIILSTAVSLKIQAVVHPAKAGLRVSKVMDPLLFDTVNCKKLAFDFSDKYIFNEGLCAIQRNGRWGFIDTTGRLALDFQFAVKGMNPPVFKEGRCNLCLVLSDGSLKPVYIDISGRPLFPRMEWSGNTPFSGGLAIVEKESVEGVSSLLFMDSLGHVMKDAAIPGYASGMRLEFRGFFDGLAAVASGNGSKWGFIKAGGKWAILPNDQWRTVGDFHEGLAFVQEVSSGKWGAIDRNGNLVLPFSYSNRPGDYAEGLSAVRNKDGQVGYMDRNGSLVIPCLYDPVGDQNGFPFIEGNTVVLRDGSYYVLTHTGIELMRIGDASSDIRMLQNGLVVYKKWSDAGFWSVGLMRTNGELLIPSGRLIRIGNFADGLAPATMMIGNHPVNGFINQKGELLLMDEIQ